MVNPEASYDSLFIVNHLEELLHGVTEGEVHLLSYLARLLALYRGAPAAEWGYRFTRTNWGAPFSLEGADALKVLRQSGWLHADARDAVAPMKCTTAGKELLKGLDEMKLYEARRPYLEAACSSAAAFPVSAIRNAIRFEPTIKSASGHTGPQELLAGPALQRLYQQFAALRTVLGEEASDLLVPSSVWLKYLIDKSCVPGAPA